MFSSLKSRIILSISGIILLSLSLITFFFNYKVNIELKKIIEENAINLLDSTRAQIITQFSLIESNRDYMIHNNKNELSNLTGMAFSQIEDVYREYQSGILDRELAKSFAKSDIEGLSYNNESGKFWIIEKEETPSENILDLDRYIIDSIWELSNEKGEGFLEFQKNGHLILYYIKTFEPWGWILGTSLDITQIYTDVDIRTKTIITELNENLIKQRVGDSGYMFVFTSNDDIIVHPNLNNSNGKELINPQTGNLLFDDFKSVVSENKQSLLYLWDKPGFEGQFIFPKKALLTYYEPLDWYIGSSYYLEDFEKQIDLIMKPIIYFLLLFFVFSLLLSIWISSGITRPLRVLVDSISKTDDRGLPQFELPSLGTSEIKMLSKTMKSMISTINTSRMELKKQRDFSMNIIEGSPDIICGISSNGQITFLNPSGVKLTGYDHHEIIGKKFGELFIQGEESILNDNWFEKMGNEPLKDFKLKLLCKNGDVKEIIWNSVIRENCDNDIKEVIGFGHDVTENIEAIAALKKSEERFHALIAANPDLIFVLDKDGRFIDYETGINDLYTTDDIIGQFLQDFLPKELAELSIANVNKTIKTQQMQSYDYQLDQDDLVEQYFEARMVPAGENTVLSIVRNITERKIAEEKLREQKLFLKLLLDLIPNQIFWKNLNSEYIGCNQSFANILGKQSPDEIIGLTDHDISITKKQADRYRQIDLHVFETGESLINDEEEFVNLEGDIRVNVTSKIPIKNKSDDVIGLLGIVIDVTDRKTTELEILQLRNNLSNIINSMPSILIGVDASCKINLWNKSTETKSGITAEQAKGKHLSEVFPSLKPEIPIIRESIEHREVRKEQKKEHKNGPDSLYEDITIYPVIASGLEGAVIRIDDKTEQVLLEEMMIQSEKMLSVGGLAAGMAHEINNPLAGMIQTASVMINRLSKDHLLTGNIKAAEEAGTNLDSIHKYMELRSIPKMLETIKDSGKRISLIVNNMLSFSRKSEGQTSEQNMNDLLDKTLELAATDYNIQKQFDFKKISIQRNYEKNLPLIKCEDAKIQQVLLNLFRNGAEAMQDSNVNNPMFILRTSYERERKQVQIEIEDNGLGMDEETRKRVFEPFFTTKAVGVGTGLGLSVSYFIITKNHDGELSVESKAGKGTTFIIRLPIKKEQKV